MTFDVPEIEDPLIVTGGASEIRKAGENIQQKMKETSNAWQPISGQYHAPEDGQVHRAMRTPEEMADELKKSAGKVADGLDAYAERLGPLRARKVWLEEEIKRYKEAKVAADLTNPAARASLAAWELRLLHQCTQLRIDRDAADSSCANSIRNTTESAGAVIGKKLLGAITRGNNVEGAMGALLQFGKLGTDLFKYYSTYFFYSNGSIKIREGWAPKLLQDIAKKGKFGKGLVKGLTGWDADAVTNGGQFLAKNAPMNPLAKPNSFGGALQAVIGRSMLKLEGKHSRVPHAHGKGLKTKWDKIGKSAKVVSRVGTGISAATTAMDSWQTDSQVHPNMGNVEKGARAGVSAAGATAGGWAGGKAGAAMGAAIGSFGGPVGTVVGGVAGGIIGGVAGGAAGGWLANKVKDPVGNLFD